MCSAIDADTALVCLSHVNFCSGARLDIGAITEAAHRYGALILWDLSHSAGALPIELDEVGADLAVGCTYKYLNGGPGSPAFAYVRRDLQVQLRQPVWGWFGQQDQFAMGADDDPAPGIERFLAGTPPVFGLLAVDAAVETVEAAGVAALWQKSQQLTAMMVDLVRDHLEPLGARLASPTDPDRRGAHVSVSHARRLAVVHGHDRAPHGDRRLPTTRRDQARPCAPLYEVRGRVRRYPANGRGTRGRGGGRTRTRPGHLSGAA